MKWREVLAVPGTQITSPGSFKASPRRWMVPAAHVHTSRFAQAPGRVQSFRQRCWGLCPEVGAVQGGSGGCRGLAPPALPGGGVPGCPAVPSSGMLALLRVGKSLWSWGHLHSSLQYPSKTLILHIPGQRQNHPTHLLEISTPRPLPAGGRGHQGRSPLAGLNRTLRVLPILCQHWVCVSTREGQENKLKASNTIAWLLPEAAWRAALNKGASLLSH